MTAGDLASPTPYSCSSLVGLVYRKFNLISGKGSLSGFQLTHSRLGRGTFSGGNGDEMQVDAISDKKDFDRGAGAGNKCGAGI